MWSSLSNQPFQRSRCLESNSFSKLIFAETSCVKINMENYLTKRSCPDNSLVISYWQTERVWTERDEVLWGFGALSTPRKMPDLLSTTEIETRLCWMRNLGDILQLNYICTEFYNRTSKSLHFLRPSARPDGQLQKDARHQKCFSWCNMSRIYLRWCVS